MEDQEDQADNCHHHRNSYGIDLCVFTDVLPLEVRANIYKLIPYEDVLSMRIVSKKVKKEIDEFRDLHIILDQTYKRFRSLCKLRVNSVKINQLDRKLHPNLKLSHPERIQKVIFDGAISPTNLRKVLAATTRLRHVVFTHQTLQLDNLFQSNALLKSLQGLQFVTNLNLQLLRYPMSDPFDDDNNIAVFLKQTFPQLHTFKLFFSLLGKWTDLLLFLQRHAETLKCLELQVGDRADLLPTQYYLAEYPSSNVQSQIDIQQLCKLQLNDFRFRDDVLFCNIAIKKIIFDIIRAQGQLDTFQFHSTADVSIKNLKELVIKNSETLTDIHIDYLKCVSQRNNVVLINSLFVDRYKVVDLNMFKSCKKLKNLALSRFPPRSASSNQHPSEGIPFVLSNFNCLSSTLEKLHLRGFTIQLEDIVKLTHQAPNLKEVIFEDGGRIRYSSLINSFLKNCPNLQNISVRPVIARGSSDASWWRETKALNLVFEHFMNIKFDLNDLDGFEATITAEDRTWINENIIESTPSLY